MSHLTEPVDDPAATNPAGRVAPFRLTVWLPLAAATIFALSTAWLAQLYVISRSENALLREEQRLADSTLREVQNQLEAERLIGNHRLSDARLENLKVYTLTAPSGGVPPAIAIVIWNPRSQAGILSAEKLPPLAPEKTYRLWINAALSAPPVDGGVFTADSGTGTAIHPFEANNIVAGITGFVVTLERADGIATAKGPIVLSSR